MNILVIRGKDAHTIRLVSGFSNIGCHVKVAHNLEEISENKCDIVFVDPSYSGELPANFNSDLVMFYDCEDSPRHFDGGAAYASLKDKVSFYAKMNYVEDDRSDGIKNIAFPLPIYGSIQAIACQSFSNWSEDLARVSFIGHGTYIGKYQPVKDGWYACTDDATSIGYAYNDGKIDFLYNQRLDWLLSAKQNNITVNGGLVFESSGNLSLEWQKRHFGEGIEQFSCSPIDWMDSFRYYNEHKISLCPTGHERISWRIFDLMAAGSVIFLTDLRAQKSLFMPQEYVTVYDGERFSTVYERHKKDMKNLWKAAQANKQFVSELTADKVVKQFYSQLQ